MRLDGQWYLCADGLERPVIRGEVLAVDGTWKRAYFLLDTGADRTVLAGSVLSQLGLPGVAAQQLGGLTGEVEAVVVQTEIRLRRETGAEVLFHGQFAAVADPAALDMSVLGRDVTGLFAMIVDRPGRVVCLLGPGRYTIR